MGSIQPGKIVLTRPSYRSHIITPPLGLGYLSSYLRKNGIAVTLIDGLKDNLRLPELVARICDEKPDAVGINCLTAYYDETVALSRELKKRGIRCIIGGVHPTFLPQQTLKDTGADFVVCGEGEIALLRLVRNGFSSDGIPGVYSAATAPADAACIIKGECVETLDELPFPDWEQMPPARYPIAPHGALIKNYPVGIITSSRGCPFECTFCASPKFYDRRIRYRSPENVVAEITELVRKFGVREIHFEDDNLTLNRAHIEKICRLLIEADLGISWACPNGIRADHVDDELLRLMKRSGCYYFAYGVESANPDILKNIKKRETIETVRGSICLADRHGIQCQGFFIFGLPGETRRTIEETIRFACTAPLARAQFLILDVLPGSELWDTLRGKFSPNWRKNSYKEPEWIPEGLSTRDLIAAQKKAFRSFYARPGVILRLLAMIKMRQLKFLCQRLFEYRIIT